MWNVDQCKKHYIINILQNFYRGSLLFSSQWIGINKLLLTHTKYTKLYHTVVHNYKGKIVMVRVKAKKQKGDDAFAKRKQKVGRKKLAPATATRA